MAYGSHTHVSNMDAEVMNLYLTGIRNYRGGKPPEDAMDTSFDNRLVYISIPAEQGVVLHRMLSTGMPVKYIRILRMSLCAFKRAFDNLERCESLTDLYIGVDCEGQGLGTDLSKVFINLYSLELMCSNTGSDFAKDVATYITQSKSLKELSIGGCCGGDEGAANLIEALKRNDTLKKLTLYQMTLSCETLISFAKMLAWNTTLQIVQLDDACSLDKEKLSSLLAEGGYVSVFKRLQLLWPEELLSELTALIRREACSPTLFVQITSAVDKRVLGEFFQAVAADNTVHRLMFCETGENAFDELVEGIAFTVRHTRTLRLIANYVDVKSGNEHQLTIVLDALKDNHSIGDFAMHVEQVTPEVATSLSKLLEVNNSLRRIEVCDRSYISPEAVKTIVCGLRRNCTVTRLTVCSYAIEYEKEIAELLDRNIELIDDAMDFVITGEDVSDKRLHALMSVHSSAGFVEAVREEICVTTEEALEEIEATLASVCAGPWHSKL